MAQNDEQIQVTVNGEHLSVPAGLNVRKILETLDIAPDRVAVELNRRIVPSGEWEQALVPDGAELEIVHFVGGG